jgi:phytoene synthase
MSTAGQAEAKLAAAPLDFRLAQSFSPVTQRAALTALFAVYLEIREVPAECRDPGVADVKLRWWEEEIGALYASKPRHPLTRTLLPHLTPLAGRQGLFLDLLAGARMDIAGAGLAGFEDVKRYCYRHSGALAELTVLAGGARSREALLAARLLGNSRRLADIAVRGGAEALQGRVYFAAEDLKAHRVDQHISDATHTDDSVRALVRDYAERARRMQAEALTGVPVDEQAAFAPARILAALALKRVAKFERAGFKPGEEPVELHPLPALFTAWRAARRAS